MQKLYLPPWKKVALLFPRSCQAPLFENFVEDSTPPTTTTTNTHHQHHHQAERGIAHYADWQEYWWIIVNILSLLKEADIVVDPDEFQFQCEVDFTGFHNLEECKEPFSNAILHHWLYG